MAYEAEKHYSDDWAKAKSRDLVRDVIKRTLLTFRKPKDLKVLCFPGIDATEVFQVYDALGIPRQNIVGLERDSYVADELEKKNLGIRVVRKSVEDFVEDESSLPFDVVSLDYTGPISDEDILTLQFLSKKIGRDRFVLHQANLLKRDHKADYIYAVGVAHSGKHKDMSSMAARMGDFFKARKNKDNTIEVKGRAYANLISNIMRGADDEAIEELFKFTSTFTHTEHIRLLECCLRKMVEGEVKLDQQHPIKSAELYIGERPEFFRYVEELIHNGLRSMLNQIPPEYRPEKQSVYNLLARVSCWRNKQFFPKDKEGYSYVSESGSPMIGEILFLEHPRELVVDSIDFAKSIGYPKEFEVLDVRRMISRLNRAIKSHNKFMKDIPEFKEDRTFLGSSAKPVLTKARAIEEMRAGFSDDEIARKYRGVNGKPLPQWRAHVTMGTYDEQPRTSEESIQEAPEDSTIEKITKEGVIDLLASGIPVNEIADTYPTSFTKGQLRAFKAHITMGTYPADK